MSARGLVVLRTSSKESLPYLINASGDIKLCCELRNGRNILFYICMFLS